MVLAFMIQICVCGFQEVMYTLIVDISLTYISNKTFIEPLSIVIFWRSCEKQCIHVII